MDCCLCRAAEVSVFPMKMQTLVLGSMAPLVHHFRPLITNSSPSLTMEDSMLVASEEATAGSVMAKHDLIQPIRAQYLEGSGPIRVPSSP